MRDANAHVARAIEATGIPPRGRAVAAVVRRGFRGGWRLQLVYSHLQRICPPIIAPRGIGLAGCTNYYYAVQYAVLLRSVKGFTRNACCWLLEAPSSPWRTRVMEGAEDEDDAPARLLATLAALQARLHPPISPADPPVVGGGNLQRSEAGGQPDRTSLAPDEPVPEGGALEGEVANGWCAGASDECDQRAAAAEEEAGAAAAEAEAVQCELDELRRSLRARCSEAAQLRRQVRDPPALRPPPSPASLYGSSTQHGEGGGSAAGCADAADCHPCA
jgi:hypothetical protein